MPSISTKIFWNIKQLMEVHEKYEASVIAVQKVEGKDVSKYGIVDYEEVEKGVYRIVDIVEKPSRSEAPSNMAVMGRYILHPSIFSFIEKTKPGKNNEIQLTDALKLMLKEHEIYAYEFEGKRFDVGGKLDWLKINIEIALKRKEFEELRKFIKDEIL